MAFSMTIMADGLTETIGNMERLRDQQPNTESFFRDACVPELRRLFRAVFDGQLGGWRPLKASTRQQKVEDGYPARPNIRTGEYRDRCIQLRGMTITRYRLQIISPVRYAAFLEFGTRTSPARPVFRRVATEMRKEIANLYTDWARSRS